MLDHNGVIMLSIGAVIILFMRIIPLRVISVAVQNQGIISELFLVNKEYGVLNRTVINALIQ